MQSIPSRVRIGFVGCGWMGQGVHLPNFVANERCVVAEFGWAFAREAAHFVDCVAASQDFRSSGEDSAKDLAVLEALFRSAQERQAVGLTR